MSIKLHKLIHSLNKSEKRYIKLDLFSKNKKTNLEVVYESFAKVKEYKVSIIKKEINSPKISRAYTINSKDLYQKILNSLRVYSSNENVDMQLEQIQSNVQVLFNRKMYKEANSEITKGVSLAKKYARPINTLNFLYYEYYITSTIKNKEEDLIHNKAFVESVKLLSNELLCEVKNRKNYNELFLLFIKNNKGLVKNIDKELKLFNESSLNNFSNLRSRLLFLTSQFYYYRLLNDKEKAIGQYKERISLVEEHIWLLNKDFEFYFVSLYNFIILLFEENKLVESQVSISNFQQKIGLHKNIDVKTKELYFYKFIIPLKLIFAIRSEGFLDITKEVDFYLGNIGKYEKKVSKVVTFQNYYYLLIIAFMSSDYRLFSEVIPFVKIIERKYWDVNQSYVLVLEYFSNFELGNFKFLPFLYNQFVKVESKNNNEAYSLTRIKKLMGKMKNPLVFKDKVFLNNIIKSFEKQNEGFIKKYRIIAWLKNKI